MTRRRILRSACVLALLAAFSSTANALFRTYVASTGVDTNPCTLTQPCRLLPAALTAVDDGGEIWMLDSANFNTSTVTIAKSVTILAIPGAVGSVVATGGGNGITVSAANIKVTLRNLLVVHLTSSNDGIQFNTGSELTVEDCEISNVQGNAITIFANNGKLTVKNTTVRDSNVGVQVGGGTNLVAAIDHVRLMGNGSGVSAGPTSKVTVSNSLISGSIFGIFADAFGAGAVRLSVEHSVSTGNSYGVRVDTNVAGDIADVSVSNSNLTHNSTAGIYANQLNVSSTLRVVADGNTITDNGNGILFNGAPIVYSRGNNTMKFNTSGDFVGGSSTPLTGQ